MVNHMKKNSLSKEAYSAAQVSAMDKYTVEELCVDLRQLMEVAGLRSAELAMELFEDRTRIAVLAGPGGNGGDALVAAKYLKLWGYEPVVTLSRPVQQLSPITLHQLAIWCEYGGGILEELPNDAEGIIDGLIGYSLKGDPKGKAASLIEWINRQDLPVLSLDVPSGLDATTGEQRNPCVKADRTVVYGVMKQGLAVDDSKEVRGEVTLVDIGFPSSFPEHVLDPSKPKEKKDSDCGCIHSAKKKSST